MNREEKIITVYNIKDFVNKTYSCGYKCDIIMELIEYRKKLKDEIRRI